MKNTFLILHKVSGSRAIKSFCLVTFHIGLCILYQIVKTELKVRKSGQVWLKCLDSIKEVVSSQNTQDLTLKLVKSEKD